MLQSSALMKAVGSMPNLVIFGCWEKQVRQKIPPICQTTT